MRSKQSKRGIDRRSFLRGALAAGGGLMAFGGVGGVMQRLAQAQALPTGEGAAADHYFVFAYFSGGWDILISLDPRDPIAFGAGNVRDTRILAGYELLQSTEEGLVHTDAGITFGPHIGDLRRHADKLAVVRGMSMETLSHEAGRRRFITGKVPTGNLARGSSAATWLAGKVGAEAPIPNLAVRVESYNVDQPNYATGLKVNSVPDLVRALRPANPGMPARAAQQLDALMKNQATCESQAASALYRAAEASRLKSLEMVEGQLDSLFDFTANTEAMQALRDHYQIPAGNAGLASSGAQAALAARSIMGGVSRCVSMQVTGGLDTHYDNWQTDQGPRQEAGFNAVSRLIEDLERSEYKGTGTSWLDHTTIVGFSEFSRTAMVNNRGGRDHALTNACFVAGGGIKGGTVVGASSDVGLAPAPANLETGRPDLGGEIIRPEHVLQVLMEQVGLGQDPDLRVAPLRAIMKG